MVSSTMSLLFLPAYLVASSWAASRSPVLAFQIPSPSAAHRQHQPREAHASPSIDRDDGDRATNTHTSRRSAIATVVSSLVLLPTATRASAAVDERGETKFVQTYDDFTITPEGWSYKEAKVGNDIGGGDLKDGDRVVFDWSGYTIGYFGRPFEAKGGPQGGAFDKEVDFYRTILGSKTLIPGLECSLRSMKPGGIRQVIIPYGPLSYPPDDKEHESVGPKPTTFSGMRALNFVLENDRVDRTLLFNVKLVRVDRSNGKGGFIRG